MTTTTELLRRAASLMRERAEAATGSVWEPTVFGVHAVDGMARHVVAGWDTQTESPQMHDRMHIASWHPAVALAVADWLDDEALAHYEDGHGCKEACPPFALARAYLGESA